VPRGNAQDSKFGKGTFHAMSLELGYWGIRGLGAPLRMMLTYAGVCPATRKTMTRRKAILAGTNPPRARLAGGLQGHTVQRYGLVVQGTQTRNPRDEPIGLYRHALMILEFVHALKGGAQGSPVDLLV